MWPAYTHLTAKFGSFHMLKRHDLHFAKVRLPLFLSGVAHVGNRLHHSRVITHSFPVAAFGYTQSSRESVPEESRSGQAGIDSPHVVADGEEQIAALAVIYLFQVLKFCEGPELIGTLGNNVGRLAGKRKIMNVRMKNSLPKFAMLKYGDRSILFFNEFARSLVKGLKFFKQLLAEFADSRKMLLWDYKQMTLNYVVGVAKQIEVFCRRLKRILKGMGSRVAVRAVFSNVFFREIGFSLHVSHFSKKRATLAYGS